jgi:hypothetical protein
MKTVHVQVVLKVILKVDDDCEDFSKVMDSVEFDAEHYMFHTEDVTVQSYQVIDPH